MAAAPVRCLRHQVQCSDEMQKSVHGQPQAVLQVLLREIRQEAGLRQQDLATRLGEPQSFVSKYESGERRLDVLELRQITAALGVPLVEFIRRLEERLQETQE